jgi:phenylalanyl-tRNA synthetase beta chain
VTIPHNRLDLRVKEDLIEEIGRVHGYEHVVLRMPAKVTPVVPNKMYYWSERVRYSLKAHGYSEVYTYAFRAEGEVELENPLAQDKKFLRKNITNGIVESLELNLKNIDLLGEDQIKIFEIGNAYRSEGEITSLVIAVGNGKGFKGQSVNEAVRNAREKLIEDLKLPLTTACTIDDTGGLVLVNNKQIGVINNIDGVMEIDFGALVAVLPEPSEDLPTYEKTSVVYKTISPYPCMLRDIAVWVPGETGREGEVLDIVKTHAGELLVNTRMFDTFTKRKEGEPVRTSYAYHLVFQSQEKTLTDDEINGIMQKVTDTLNNNEGWQVR